MKYCIIKINDYWINERGNIYDTVRMHWKVSLNRVKKIPYVLASHNGVIEEVYEVDKWFKAEDVPGRCMFEGKVASDEIRSLFVKKRLPKKYIRKGMASPVLYHD